MSHVFVIDSNNKPQAPVHPGYARRLLKLGLAAVLKRYPFTLVLKRAMPEETTSCLRVKIDPGSRTTGLAIVNENSGQVVFAAELVHRGHDITKAIASRRGVRRSRRRRFTRYRAPRFANRRRRAGWLPPSSESRIHNVLTWVQRLSRLCPLYAISLELVRFDMQAMEKPEISGILYQQGTLAGYEIREYLLEKWERRCAYCGKKDVRLQVEHIVPRAKGGTDRVSNLTLACEPCNTSKGTQDIHDFLKKKPELLSRIQAQAKAPLVDAAAVNVIRYALLERLKALGLPVEYGSGGRTKFNRTQRGLPKTHWCDAANVGASTPETLHVKGVTPLLIKAYGHGCRQVCLMDKHGFPRSRPKEKHPKHGFRTGDHVRAVVPKGVRKGTHVGRMSSKASGSFTIATRAGSVADIGHRWCVRILRADGYGYSFEKGGSGISSPA